MKKIFSLFAFFGLLGPATFSQVKNSENGYYLTTENTIRILTVYAQVDYASCPGDNQYGANSEWPSASPPYWETGGGSYSTPEPLFDVDLPITSGTATDYYYQASLGENTILGDYINLVIPCTASGLSSYGVSAVITALENISDQITTAHGKILSDFDKTNGNGKGLSKSPGSDSKIDLLLIIWKNNSYGFGDGCAGGMGVNGYYTYQVNDNGTTWNIPIVTSFSGCSRENAFYTLTAEYLHALLGGNNWHTGGGAGPFTFLTAPKTLCTTAQYDNQSNMFCGYDRNQLGWKGLSKSYLISARNQSNAEIASDLTQPSTAGPFEATYYIRDFAVTGDAIRIRLPYIAWTTNGDPKNQYLWLENHQMISNWDHQHFQGGFESTSWEPGMMAYIQVGKDRKVGSTTSDDIFIDNLCCGGSGNLSDYQDPNGVGSWIFPLTAEGNYDFKYRTDLIDYWCGWGDGVYPRVPLDKSQSLENPLTGCSDVFNFFDYNAGTPDGKIITPDDGCDVYRGDVVNNSFVCSMQGYGDEDDSWNIGQGKTKLSISTNPTTSTILTLRSHSFYDNPIPPHSISFQSYDNRTIHLNNLSIEILEEIPNYTLPLNMDGEVPNDLKVKIKWDVVNINSDVRWCAPDIQLHPSVHTISGNLDDASEYSLNITAGNSITLDRGESPTQHVAFEGSGSTEWKFTEPTIMTCLPNSYFHLDEGSDLIIKNGSTLIMQNGSKLEVHEYSHVYVEDGSTLIIEDGAMLYIWHDGLVHIKPGGTLIVRNSTVDKGIWLDYLQYATYTAELKVEGILSFEDGADFLYQGTGFYHFVGTPTLNLSTGSDVVWIGTNQYKKIVELDDDVVLNINGHPTTIKSGTIAYHDNAKLEIENTSLDVDHANFDGNSATPVGNTGIYGNEIITKCDIKNFNFFDLATAVELRHVDDPLQVNIEDGKFKNCTIGISGYQVDKLVVDVCGIEDPTVGNSRGLSFLHCKNMKLKNTAIRNYDFGAYLSSVKAMYFDNGSYIINAVKGIYATDSKVWLRNGSTIDQSQSVAAEMNGSWNISSGNYTSMLTVGDKGCGGIIRSAGEGVKGTNTVLSIDAVTHDQNDDNNGLFDHNWFVRNTGNTALLFDICYTQVSSPVPPMKARRNLWCLAGASSNPAPSASNYHLVNSSTCPSATTIITLDKTPVSVCIPSTYDCTTCDETLKIGDGEEEDPAISVAEIVTDAFRDAYSDFIIADNDDTREAFTDISVLSTNYDESTDEWSITTIAGVVLPTPDSVIHLIMVSKILQEESDSGVEKLTTHSKDIFAKYYWELMNGTQAGKIPMFTVYPNPAEDKVIVEMKDLADIAKISIVDLFGRELYSEIIDEKISIDVSNMPDGLYLVRGERNDSSISEVHTIVIQ